MVAQVMVGASLSGAFAGAALLAKELSGRDSLAALAAAGAATGSALSAVPLARLMARRGRRHGLRTGYLIGLVGGVSAVTAALSGFYPLLVVGLLLIGTSQAASLATRFAAADLVDETGRARAISTLVWTGTVGSVLGPSIALGFAGDLGEWLGLPRLAGPYVVTSILLASAAVFVELRLRPDPLVAVGGVDETHADPARVGRPRRSTPLAETVARIWNDPGARLAVVGMVVGHMVMVGIMVMTPLHMKDGDQALRIIGLVISLHIIGMYAFSPLSGWLTGRLGSRPVLALAGGVLLAGATVAGRTDSTDRTGMFVGLFLIGLGWSFSLIAASALVTQRFDVKHRVEVQGVADLAMTGFGALAGISSGTIVELADYRLLTQVGSALAVGLVLMAATNWLRSQRREDQVPVAVHTSS